MDLHDKLVEAALRGVEKAKTLAREFEDSASLQESIEALQLFQYLYTTDAYQAPFDAEGNRLYKAGPDSIHRGQIVDEYGQPVSGPVEYKIDRDHQLRRGRGLTIGEVLDAHEFVGTMHKELFGADNGVTSLSDEEMLERRKKFLL